MKRFTGIVPLCACVYVEIEAENHDEALMILRQMVKDDEVDLMGFDHEGEHSFFVEEELEK